MAETQGLFPDRADDREDLSFTALRRLGIAYAQGLAAENWTDYNVHDPGVTLLEQICYALTDLVYRTEFDVADHLTSPDGEIDFEQLGLALPEDIFPCRPTTETDYRRAILDAVAAIDDVTIRPMALDQAGNSLPRGLYRILIRPRPGTEQADRTRIRVAVERVYSQLRNLCEDLEQISFVNEIEFEVCAVVEIDREQVRDPGEILAEIYHLCAERVASRVRFHPFENARRADRTLEDLFTGPLGQRGICDEEDLSRVEKSYSVSDFFNLISGVEGVAYVSELYFQMDGEIHRDSISSDASDQVLRLHIPRGQDQVKIQLSSLGRSLNLPFESLQNRLEVFALKGAGSERAVQDIRSLYSAPRGEYRDLRQYTSIQTHLPSIYGVAADGVSESLPADQRARSRQLKGYLLLFDQMLSNCTANSASLRSLYSRDGHGDSSYLSQVLDESQVSGIARIYPQQSAEVMASIVARYDNFANRKGRLLDYLLALYGESFNQNSLRTFNHYAMPGERERTLVENRARFLHAIEALTRDRGAAGDYLDSNRKSVSGLQHRVSCLLGFVDHRRKVLTDAFRAQGLYPLSDDPMLEPRQEEEALGLCDSSDFQLPENPWEDEVPLLADADSDTPRAARQVLSLLMQQVGHLLPGSGGKIREGVLRSGISLANYRLGQVKGSGDWQAFLMPDVAGPWWRLGEFADRQEAIIAVNRLRRLILLLNTESEGMHVVEHILLRPRNAIAGVQRSPVSEIEFFSLRLSVVFPAWSARFQDERFRQLARETLRLNCPAHLVPELIWLGFDDMLKFEQLQADWLDTLCDQGGATATALDDAAARLVEFLFARKGEACWALAPQGNSESTNL